MERISLRSLLLYVLTHEGPQHACRGHAVGSASINEGFSQTSFNA